MNHPRFTVKVISGAHESEVSSSSYEYARKLFFLYVHNAVECKKEDYTVILYIDESCVARYHAPRGGISNG